MAIKYDSEANTKVASTLKESIDLINNGIGGSLTSDFAPLTDLGLFSSQISNLKKALDSFNRNQESFLTIVQNNKFQWGQVDDEVGIAVSDLNTEVTGSKTKSRRKSSGSSSSSGPSSSYHESSQETVAAGKSIKTEDVNNLVSKFDENTLLLVLKKIYAMNGNKNLGDLLTDQSKSGILLAYIKKILGDTTELSLLSNDESDLIQKLILTKLNKNNLDVTTEDGVSSLEKEVLEKMENVKDEGQLEKAIYGDNTTEVNLLGGDWIVAKTKTDLQTYASYISSHGVRQNANTSEWGDSCLAFAGAHAYDLYNGTKTSGGSAANYAHSSSFKDYIDDDKQKVLSKIYEEIMSGRPVVLQVNGNKAGTSRHFVTVVGFKKGVTSGSTLTDKDLLIVDSWDGKVERMDTDTSRFFTSGKDCHKDYSGYRLRVFKDA